MKKGIYCQIKDLEILKLNKSYRTTIEIMDEANKINELLKLDKARVPINEDDIFHKLQKKYSKKAEEPKKEKTKKKNKLISTVKNKLTVETKEIPTNKIKLNELPFDADECTKKVYQCIPSNKVVSCDYLVQKSGYETSEVMFALTELEMNEVINNLPGGRIEIK